MSDIMKAERSYMIHIFNFIMSDEANPLQVMVSSSPTFSILHPYFTLSL